MVLSSYVGASVKRKEDPRLITGSSTYVDDIKLSGMTHAVFVRSSYAHAKIKGIDKSAALAMPGVLDVMTGDELRSILKDFYGFEPSGDTAVEATIRKRRRRRDLRAEVRPLATARSATSASRSWPLSPIVETAQDAAEVVEVDYEVLEAVIDPYEAMKDGAPQLYGRSRTTSVCARRAFTAISTARWPRRDQGEGKDSRAPLPPCADGRARCSGDP